MGKPILPPGNVIAKNIKRAPQTSTQLVEGGGAGLGIGRLKREDEGNCLSRVFLACGSVGRKANGKADHDLQLTQDFEQLLTGTPCFVKGEKAR